MSPDFWTTVQEAADNAPEAGYPNVSMGKLTVVPFVVKFSNKDGVKSAEKSVFKQGATLGDRDMLELEFTVDIKEMNPNLNFDYVRRVGVRKSGRNKTDWDEIVRPSLEAVFGKQWAKTIIGGKGVYVELEDVPNVAGKAGDNGKVWGVPKFLRVFKNKAECAAAHAERFKSHASTSDESTDSGEIPEEVLKQVRGLIGSVGDKKAKEMLASKPFGDYEADALMEAAQAE